MSKEELHEKVVKSIENIRPFLEADGGDVSLVEITDDRRVMLEFHGACTNCSMSGMTLKAGLEGAIKEAVPEVLSVEAINL